MRDIIAGYVGVNPGMAQTVLRCASGWCMLDPRLHAMVLFMDNILSAFHEILHAGGLSVDLGLSSNRDCLGNCPRLDSYVYREVASPPPGLIRVDAGAREFHNRCRTAGAEIVME